jgi:invasion protein IalB
MFMTRARLGGAFVLAASLLSSAPVFAQAASPTPAATASPAAGGAAAPAPAAPTKLDLTPLQPQWTKLCSPDPGAGNKQTCAVTRDFLQGQSVILSVTIISVASDEKHIARFVMPQGFLLKPGFRLILDKGEPLDGKYAICIQNICVGEVEFGAPTLAAMKKAQTASVIVRNSNNAEITFNATMKDFGTAFDGPAIDPKVLQEQQQQLQKQLEDEAVKQRQQLEQQSQKGLQQGGAAPAPAATPAK